MFYLKIDLNLGKPDTSLYISIIAIAAKTYSCPVSYSKSSSFHNL